MSIINGKVRLSNSANNRYNMCPKEYYLHYVEKLRPTAISSPLIFGSAIDKACESYLLKMGQEGAALQAIETFKKHWKETEHNGETVELYNSTAINYRDNDFDAELLSESDNQSLIENTSFASVSDLVKDGTDKERIAYANWLSLYRKGNLLVTKFCQWVDETIEVVLACQKEISLEDEDGNAVTGLADFIVKMKGYDKPLVLDLKTSAMFYARDSVKESDQLALYTFYLREFYPDMERAGYVVLQKQIKKNREKICSVCGHDGSGGRHAACNNEIAGKRCNGKWNTKIFPEATLQYIHDEISEEFIQKVIEGFNNNVKKIVAGEFPENRENCSRYNGKVQCDFAKYCASGGTCMDGLIKKESK